MRSMTGHGHGECSRNGYKVCAELSSVNRKQLEITLNLPRELDVIEAQMREILTHTLSRGKVTARVTLHLAETAGPSALRLNHALARAYANELKKLAQELDLAGPITLELVARAPGVLETSLSNVDAEAYWSAVEKALQTALAELIRTREREGGHLAEDLARRIGIMRKAVARVRKRAPLVQKRYREQIATRLKEAGLTGALETDERLLKELVLFADRSDISEELARLESHFKQFEDCRKSREPMGRMLDFLAQEMNREINTIGSKANDALIAQEVVTLKTELEKFREQAMNVE